MIDNEINISGDYRAITIHCMADDLHAQKSAQRAEYGEPDKVRSMDLGTTHMLIWSFGTRNLAIIFYWEDRK